MSTNPGATIKPSASMVRAACSSTSPMATTLPPVTATLARRDGAPVPSTTVPPRINRSSIAATFLSACAVFSRVRYLDGRDSAGRRRELEARLRAGERQHALGPELESVARLLPAPEGCTVVHGGGAVIVDEHRTGGGPAG